MLQMSEIYVSEWNLMKKLLSHSINTKYSRLEGVEGEGVHPGHFI